MAAHNYIRGASAVEIAERVETAIRKGRLAPGASLPTVRAGAEAAAVSPATVAAAYRRLRDRGLVVTRGRGGTQVSPQPPLRASRGLPLPPGVRDLATGNPDPQLLPALGPALRAMAPPRRLYGEDLADPELLALTRARLRADGAPSEHITVVSGALDGIERALSAHLRAGDRVAVEDPAFSGTLALLHPLGLEPVPVAIDDRGLIPSALQEVLRRGVSALIVTPRAQNPTGAALDAQRAAALRKVLARDPDVLVLEDDHAGAISGASAQTLCTGRRRFAIARSFSKALGPDLRVAIVSGDVETIARIEGRQLIGMRWVSHVLQQVVVSLLRERGMEARLTQVARTYKERRDALVDALGTHGIEARAPSGLNVWVPVPEEAPVIAALLGSGYAITAGERFRLRSGPAVRITTASLLPEEAPAVAQALSQALSQALGPTPQTLRT